MKQLIDVPIKNENLCMIDGITFAQVPYWFPCYNYRDLKMNIIRPFSKVEDKRPLVIWICGGAWITMDRSAHTPYLAEYARHGYIVASIEYRLSGSACFPAQLQDVKAAIRYLRAHAPEYGIDPEHIALMGESAGGYLAAMAGAANGSEFDVGEYPDQSSHVQAVVDFYGPVHFTGHAADNPQGCATPEQMLLGYNPQLCPQRAMEADVTAYIDENTPPYFILQGMEDPFVSPENAEYLYEALTAKKISAQLYEIRGAGHASPEFYQKEMTDKILQFLDAVLKK